MDFGKIEIFASCKKTNDEYFKDPHSANRLIYGERNWIHQPLHHSMSASRNTVLAWARAIPTQAGAVSVRI